VIEKKTDFLRVPYGQAVYGEEEIDAVVAALRSSTQMGQHVHLMEEGVSKLFQKKFGIMVNSGSSANYLAIEILDLPEGSEVITPALTFSTTVAPLVRNGLVPAFVDVEESTYNIDVNKIEQMINENTRALMIPNLLGNLPDWSAIHEIAKKYNLITIEDSADTLGATIDHLPAGRFVDISTTSFYGSHVINCAGNGGMLCVNDETLKNRAKLLRSWGRSSSLFMDSEKIENRFNVSLGDISYDAKFVFEKFGYNLEPSEIGAAFGLVQLEKLENNIDLRSHWFEAHQKFFSGHEDLFILPKQLTSCRTGWLAYPIIVRDQAPFNRTELQIFLEKRNIQTRTVFTGNILRQPCFTNSKNVRFKRPKEELTFSDQVMRGGMLLACHHGLNQEQVDHIHDSIEVFLRQVK
jgi:CDP-6-deoxy-D-xylo-4-hexulose-3-dehydrase